MSHTPTVLVVMAATLAVGCSQPMSPVSPSSLALSADAGAASQSGWGSTTSARAFELKGKLEGTYAGSGEPPLVTVHVDGDGTASHLGRFTYDSTHVVNFIDLTGSGTASLAAANGDRVTGELRGVATPQEDGVFHIVETLTVTGGTGRFENASGEVIFDRFTFPAGPANGTTTGSLQGHVIMPR